MFDQIDQLLNTEKTKRRQEKEENKNLRAKVEQLSNQLALKNKEVEDQNAQIIECTQKIVALETDLKNQEQIFDQNCQWQIDERIKQLEADNLQKFESKDE